MERLPLRLLLIEDNEDDALLIVEELSERYTPEYERVYTRQGMRRALNAAHWDLVISDHNLPGFSAIEALRLVLESNLDLPFIIVSGTIGEALAVEAMKAGAQDFIMKDSLAKLGPAVDHAMQAQHARRMHREAQNEVRNSRERLRQLASHLETVREEERARLAREIHDELGGLLTALKMDISWLSRRLEEDEPGVQDKLSSMTALTDTAIKTMRRIITDLRPSILDDLGLIAAIEWQFTEFQKRMSVDGDLELSDEAALAGLNIEQSLAVAVFRIFQESLTNVARHAQADRVDVKMAVQGGEFTLSVTDNGRGVAEEELIKKGSYGVLGMRERAHSFGGKLEIKGGAGAGTTVALRLPLVAQAEGEALAG